MLTIYGADLSAPANKVRMAANALGLEYEYKRVSIKDGEHMKPEFKKLNPACKVPAIVDGEFTMFESNAIIRYLADKQGSDLYPKDIKQRARVDQWIDFVSLHVGAALNRVVFNRIFAPIIKAEVDERSLADGLKFLDRFLPVLDEQLAKSAFLAGEKMTLADINLVASLDPADASGIDLSKYSSLSKLRSQLREEEFYTKCHKEWGEILKQMT